MNKIAQDVGSTKSASVPRPVVTLSYAQTLDGRLATSTGSSQWISAPQSLRFSHELRAEHEAIMVGAGTVCVDNPRLRQARTPRRSRVEELCLAEVWSTGSRKDQLPSTTRRRERGR
jgi:hypothetical protein